MKDKCDKNVVYFVATDNNYLLLQFYNDNQTKYKKLNEHTNNRCSGTVTMQLNKMQD